MTQGDRDEVGSARVELFLDEGGVNDVDVPMVAFPDHDYDEVGDFVADRIESSGIISRVDRPEKGDRTDLGVVWWDERGMPTRLEGEEVNVQFDETGTATFDDLPDRTSRS